MAFKDIVGQDVAVRSVAGIIERGEAAGAYLFLGPDGVGKRTLALEFAKAVNCDRRALGPCDECIPCRKIISKNHPDIFNIYPEGPSNSIKIDKIRDIIYQSSLKPYEAKKKVFIINDAEAQTEEAQNALLKLLEEPPENHILILTSSSSAGLLSTVTSRCKTIKFSLIDKNKIELFLKAHDFGETELGIFSHMAMGSIGRAFSFKEKDIIALRDKVVDDFFLKKAALLREDAISVSDRGDIEEMLFMLLSWYRDMLVAKFNMDKDSLFNIDRSSEIFSYAGRFSEEKLEKDIMTIIDTVGYVRSNVNTKTSLFNMSLELKRQSN